MKECICSSCKNLKSGFDDEGVVKEAECEYGFPSQACEDCEGEDCDTQCSHYIKDDEEDKYVIIHCKQCGKELKKSGDDIEEEDVYCITCFLEKE